MTLDEVKKLHPREHNEQIAARRAKLASLKAQDIAPFKHGVARDTTAAEFRQRYAAQSRAELAASDVEHSMAGRIRAVRMFGKAAFFQLEDGSARYQAFLAKEELGVNFQFCKELLEVGDIVLLRGTAMKTKTDELTLRAKQVTLLTKSIRPLPEKVSWLERCRDSLSATVSRFDCDPEDTANFSAPFLALCWLSGLFLIATASWRWRLRCCIRLRVGQGLAPSRRTTIPCTWTCFCVSRQSCI